MGQTGSGSSASGCTGCLGCLLLLAFIGTLFFGGGVIIRIGLFKFGFGNPIDRNQIISSYLNDLESDVSLTDKAVQQFHAQFNQNRCQEIYEQTAEAFKSKNSQESLIKSCSEIKSRFGTVQSTQLTDWWVQPGEAGSVYILVHYNTIYSKSTSQESFIWLVKDNKSQLLSYQIFPEQTSDLLGYNGKNR